MIQTKTLYQQIQDLYLMCFRESSPHFILTQNAKRYILQLLSQFDIIIYKDKKDNVLGCVIYQKFYNILLDCNECFIHEWFIHPEHRKKRVGMKLYVDLCNKAKEIGCKRIRGTSYNKMMLKTALKNNRTKSTGQMLEKEL